MPPTLRSPRTAAPGPHGTDGPDRPDGSRLLPSVKGGHEGRRRPLVARVWPSLLRPLLGAAALVFLMGDDGISREEYLCEAAVLHLSQCCPDFPAKSLHCVQNGCDGTLIPDLREERSLCLRGKSCEELVASGACDPNRWEQVNACDRELCSEKVPSC